MSAELGGQSEEMQTSFASLRFALGLDFFDIHEANVVWDGESRLIAVDAVDVEPIAGMALLDGHELTIEMVKGGRVRIKALA